MSQDIKSRVAVETLITTGQVHVAGEVTTDGYADVMGIVRDTVLNIGYDSSEKGFDGNSCGVSISIGQQSQDIAQGVDDAYEHRVASAVDPLDLQGAGDQGLMFGYACDDTKELMPLPIWLAHALAQQLTKVRKSGALPYLRPDGKTQVTIEYEGDRAIAINTVVISSQHAEEVDVVKKLTPEVLEYVIDPILATIAPCSLFGALSELQHPNISNALFGPGFAIVYNIFVSPFKLNFILPSSSTIPV